MEGDGSVLVLTGDMKEVQHLRQALEEENIAVTVLTAGGVPGALEGFVEYDCIIMANLGRDAFLDDAHMRALQQAVYTFGVGFIMIGGENSFGPGGYLGTPIEEMLLSHNCTRLHDRASVPRVRQAH